MARHCSGSAQLMYPSAAVITEPAKARTTEESLRLGVFEEDLLALAKDRTRLRFGCELGD